MIHVRQYVKGQVITESGIYQGVEIDRYHGGKLCDGPSISSSGLRTIFSESPMDYWIDAPINPNRRPPPEKEPEHYIVGRATHHLALGEDRFRELYDIEPETAPAGSGHDGKKWNNNAGYARDWHAERALAGITVITGKQVDQIRGMAGVLPWQEGLVDSGLKNCRLVEEEGVLNGLIEHTIALKDRETGLWLLIRPDAIPLTWKIAADLKTTMRVDYRSLQRTLEDYRYDMQAALIRRGLREVCGIEIEHFSLVFVQKNPPHAVQVTSLKQSEMDEGEIDIQTALVTFARCLEANHWPHHGGTQSDGIYLERDPYARGRAADRRLFLQEDRPI